MSPGDTDQIGFRFEHGFADGFAFIPEMEDLPISAPSLSASCRSINELESTMETPCGLDPGGSSSFPVIKKS